MDYLITTHEILRAERSTPTTSAPVKVKFTFLIGYGIYISVKAEVTEERDGDGATGHYVTILEVAGLCWIDIYEKERAELREAIEQKAIECSHCRHGG